MEVKKLAVFVEGLTEQLFVERLVRALVEAGQLQIEKAKTSGGSSSNPRHRRRIQIDASSVTVKYYVLIQDCSNDERVQSDIRDNYDRLVSENFRAIIGVRDIYPGTVAEVPKYKQFAKYKLKTTPIDPSVIFAVMEVEAWFLAEMTHYARVTPTITHDTVTVALSGFDPGTGDVTARPHPAGDLNLVYRSVGESYEKTETSIKRTICALSMEEIDMTVAERVTELKELIAAIAQFLGA